MPSLLNPRHEAYCVARSRGSSQIKSYELAGFEKPRRGSASALEQRPDVSRRIRELVEMHQALETRATERAMERAAMSRAEVLMELSHVGRGNVGDVLIPGTLDLDMDRLTPSRMAAIAELSVVEGEDTQGRKVKRTKVKYHNKIAALGHLGTHHGLFVHRTANLNLNIHTTNTGEEESY